MVKASSENLKRTQVLPTPESPINKSLNRRSYVFFAIFQSQLNNNDVTHSTNMKHAGSVPTL